MKKTLCAILILIVAFIPFSSFADEYEEDIDVEVIFDETIHDEPDVMFISGYPYVRLRQTDSIELPYLVKMPYGSEVTIVSTLNNANGEEWSLIIYNGLYGFCKSEYLVAEIDSPAYSTNPQTIEEAFGSNLLMRGNSTPDYRVKNLQLCLIDGGFLNDENGADGYFGKQTYKALFDFQKSQGLPQTGQAGNVTKIRLWYMYADFLSENGVMQ